MMNQDGVLFFELLDGLAPFVEDEKERRRIAAEITVAAAFERVRGDAA